MSLDQLKALTPWCDADFAGSREVKDLDENHSAFLTHGAGGGLSRRWKPALGGPPLGGPL